MLVTYMWGREWLVKTSKSSDSSASAPIQPKSGS